MITAVVITYNEEKYLSSCLKSLTFCNEIIIVDSFSQDKTIKIAKKFTKKVFQKKLNDNFARQRNFALKKASNNWVLFIDADEVVSLGLKKEILKVLKKQPEESGFLVPRVDYFLGKKMKYGEFLNFKLLRLARKNQGIWKRPVHEVWKIKGKIASLKKPLLHYSHNNINQTISKINYYSSINANYLFQNSRLSSALDIITYPVSKFILNYFIKRGFKDGVFGLIFSIIMSYHSFLVRTKLYLLKHGNR